MNANIDELTSIDEIGDKMAKSLVEFFEIPTNRALIEKLKNLGVNPQVELSKYVQNSIFDNLKIVATGTLEKFKRDDIQKLVEENGGKLASSVSKNTNFVIAGENAGSKLEKAQALGIRVITEEQFDQVLKLGSKQEVLTHIESL